MHRSLVCIIINLSFLLASIQVEAFEGNCVPKLFPQDFEGRRHGHLLLFHNYWKWFLIVILPRSANVSDMWKRISRRCQQSTSKFVASSKISSFHLIRRCVTAVETASLNNITSGVAVKFKWMMPINIQWISSSIKSCSLDTNYWCFQVIVCFIRVSYLNEVVATASAWMPRHDHCYF